VIFDQLTSAGFPGADPKAAPGIHCSHFASQLIDEFADSGILFLDEIGELGLDEQAMLLRAIEEKRFLPWVGPRSPQRFSGDLGSRRDPQTAVQSGRFRDDLLARTTSSCSYFQLGFI
jgi:sigma54-dependent transcription regulator